MKNISVIILLLSVLLVGCVSLTKDLTITYINGDGIYKDNTWTVSAYPNETKVITLRISNSAKTSAIVQVSVTGNISNLTGEGKYTIAAKGFKDITFTWVVSSSIIPNRYTGYVTISPEITCTKSK
jgi:hypothetical protein